MPLPRHYERLVLNWLKSVEGELQSAPNKEFRQLYFGSLLHDSNTFLREWPHLHFEPGFGAEMTPRRTVTEAAGSEKFVDGPALTVDFMAGPSGSAVPPFRLGCQEYCAFPKVIRLTGPVKVAAAFFTSSSNEMLTVWAFS